MYQLNINLKFLNWQSKPKVFCWSYFYNIFCCVMSCFSYYNRLGCLFFSGCFVFIDFWFGNQNTTLGGFIYFKIWKVKQYFVKYTIFNNIIMVLCLLVKCRQHVDTICILLLRLKNLLQNIAKFIKHKCIYSWIPLLFYINSIIVGCLAIFFYLTQNSFLKFVQQT